MQNNDKTYIPVYEGYIGASTSPFPQYSGAPNPDQGVEAATPDTIPLMKGHNQFARQSSLNQQQHQNAILQMQRSQEYNLQNMQLQNQFQIEAEERAQKWNSIGAQIDRGQRAGVSALATIGAGSSQSMGVSSAPSTNTPQPVGASAGQADGGIGFGDIAKLAMQSGIQFANLKADLNVKNAEAFNLRQQGNESISRAFGNWIDNSFKPFLNSANLDKTQAEALSAKCKAIVESYWISGKDEDGNPLYQSKIKTELRKAIADAGLTEQEQNTSFAMMWNFVTSGYKNISEANLADTEAQDLKDTVDSRNAANNANAREANASAEFKELNNEMFKKYGVSYNSSLPGAIVQGSAKFLESVSKFLNPDKKNPEGYVELIKSITDHDIEDFNELLRYISPQQRYMQDTFLDACERFKDIISGKEETVRNALDISNPLSGTW